MGRFLFQFLAGLLVTATCSNAYMCETNADCEDQFLNCCLGVCTFRKNCDGSCLVEEDCNAHSSEVCVAGYCENRSSVMAGTPPVPRESQRRGPCGVNCRTGGTASSGSEAPRSFTDQTMVEISLMPQVEFMKGSEIPVTAATAVTRGTKNTAGFQDDFIIASVGLFLLVLNVIAVSYCISRAGAKRLRTESGRDQARQGPTNGRLEPPAAFVIDLEPESNLEVRENLPPYDFSAAYQSGEVFCSEVRGDSSGTISRDNAPPPYSNAVQPLQSTNSFQRQSSETTADTFGNSCGDVSTGRGEADVDDPPPYRSISSERLDVLPPSYEETLRKPDDYSEVTTGL